MSAMPLPVGKIEFVDHQLLIDSIPALIHTSLPDGYLDYFNQRWLEYVGLRLEDVEGWQWTNSIHPDDVAGMVEKWRACLASGEVFEYKARMRRWMQLSYIIRSQRPCGVRPQSPPCALQRCFALCARPAHASADGFRPNSGPNRIS